MGRDKDDTDRREAEDRLRLSGVNADDLIFEWDVTTQQVRWFGDIDGLLGYAQNEFPRDIYEMNQHVHPEDREAFLNAVLRTMSVGVPFERQYRLKRKDGRYLTIHSRGIVLRDKNHLPRKWIGVNTNITDRPADQPVPPSPPAAAAAKTRTASIRLGLMQQPRRVAAAESSLTPAQDALGMSEERFRTAARIASDLIFEWDVTTDNLQWFGDIDRMFGYGPNEFPRDVRGTVEQVHPDDRERFLNAVLHSVSTAEPFHQEYRLRKKDGDYLHISSRGVVLCDERDLPRKWIGVNTDITEYKHTEETLKESERRLADIIDFLPDATLVIDRDGKVIAWNHAIEVMTGVKAAEMLGRGDYEYALPFYGERRPVLIDLVLKPDPEIEQRYADISRQDDTLSGEAYMPKLGSGQTYLYATAAALRDSKGRAVGAIESIRDISERKHAEEAMQRAKEAAEASDHAKSDFLANMSHEIRTPLSGVIGLLRFLCEAELAEPEREYAKLAFESAVSLLTILNDILDYSRLSAGKLKIAAQPFDLHELTHKAADLLRAKAREKNLVLELDYPADIPRWVIGDAGRIRQVLLNLLGNAVKFTDAGFVAIRVRNVAGAGPHPDLQIQVEDSGIGIPPDLADGLFDQFVQLPTAGPVDRRGTGLGLSIAKKLVELMGGRITVESRPNAGSTFSFTLCMPPAVTPEKPPPEPRAAFKKPVALESKAHVLLAEDDQINQIITRKMLENMGCLVQLANNGREALEKWENEIFDLIIMDARMPVMDGYEAAAEIRRRSHPGQHIPIIALTAHAIEGSRERCLAAGMDDYISKPMDYQVLEEKLERWTKKP